MSRRKRMLQNELLFFLLQLMKLRSPTIFKIEDADGREVARVTKKFADLAREMFNL